MLSIGVLRTRGLRPRFALHVQLFSGISNVHRGNTYETFSLHLQNSIRDGEVGNYLFLTDVRIQRGIGGPDTPPTPRKITSYIGFYRNKDLHPPIPPPPPKKNKIKSCPPPPPPINVSTLLNRKKYSCNKNPTKNTLIRVFFCYLSLDAPGPCFYLRGEGGGGGGVL